MTSREVIRMLKAAGFIVVDQKGSQVQFRHPQRPGRVTVPHPKRDLHPKTVKSIEWQSGLKLR